MIKSELNDRMAEVMGLSKLQGFGRWLFPIKEGITLDDAITDWNPCERIDQAMMVLDKFPAWELCRKDKYIARVWYESYKTISGEYGGMADTAALAICFAVNEAQNKEKNGVEKDD